MVTGLVGGLFTDAANAVFSGAAHAVGSAAHWVIGQLAGAIQSTTTPDPNAGWFSGPHGPWAAMRGVAAVLALPLLFLGVLQGLWRRDPAELMRRGLLFPALAGLGLVVSVGLVDVLLKVTDWASAVVAANAGGGADHFLGKLGAAFGGGLAAGALPALVTILLGIVAVVGAFLLWAELILRSAAVFIAMLFLPLGLAALLWPAASGLLKRLAEFITAFVLSKLVIVAVLVLGAAAVTGAVDVAGTGQVVGSTLAGLAMICLAGFAPFTLMRWIPLAETAAVAAGLGRRPLQAAGRATNSSARAGAVLASSAVGTPASGVALTAMRFGTGLPLAAGVVAAHKARGALAGRAARGDGAGAGRDRPGEAPGPDRPAPAPRLAAVGGPPAGLGGAPEPAPAGMDGGGVTSPVPPQSASRSVTGSARPMGSGRED